VVGEPEPPPGTHRDNSHSKSLASRTHTERQIALSLGVAVLASNASGTRFPVRWL
jgi:hypothetical protein